MSDENDFIGHMRALATHPGARGLMDDAALLPRPDGPLILTHDMLVEGVHFLPDDPAGSVAWKLLAVNMSDLAAKGAKPVGVLMGFGLGGDAAWDRDFVNGLGEALAHFDAPLLGGDTVRMPPYAPRTLGLTAIGAAPATGAPDRRGAKPDDLLFVTGTIGDAGAGLALLMGQEGDDLPDEARAVLIEAYRQPRPCLPLGMEIAPYVSAMADISDGLLIDAQRIAQASNCAIRLNMDAVPLSATYAMLRGNAPPARMAAATAGDDYQLLFTAAPEQAQRISTIAQDHNIALACIGTCEARQTATAPPLLLMRENAPIPLPPRLGFEHGAG